ncbi:MAG: hypothetical protein ACI9YH_002648 [Colwellia sp.]|jgi:hypothetical protein
MDGALKIFSSDIAVAIAWLCTVASCVYALIQKSNVTNITHRFDSLTTTHNNLKIQNNSLVQKYQSLELSSNELTIQNTNLEQKITEIENNDIHDNYQDVHQSGETNVNLGVLKGDFNFSK